MNIIVPEHKKHAAVQSSVDEYIQTQDNKSLLRFITCGSVDDGKSTLIGRLLYESKLLFEDQITALKADSIRSGTQGADIDFALLVDGLASEREQGITIDVAYRFFNTDARKFIVIDTPGHEQYTRNMATGASQAQLAVLLVDARLGLSTQTKRHSYIVNALGVKNIVVAINKMDLVDYSQERYAEIIASYRAFADQIGIEEFTAIPMSALKGDNIIEKSANMPWYEGVPLMTHLNTVPIGEEQGAQPFRMNVQWVNRPHLDFRGFSGRVASGRVQLGDKVTVLPSGQESRVAKIVTMPKIGENVESGELQEALPNESVTICLTDEIDVSRGDLLCGPESVPALSDRFESRLLWMSEEVLRPGQSYIMKVGTQTVNVTISQPKYAVDINTLAHVDAQTLNLNEIGVCIVNAEKRVPFQPYTDNKELGSFILINRMTNATIAMGLIEKDASVTSIELRTDELSIDRGLRADQKNQKPVTLWYTGLKWSGKTFIANALERKLYANNNHSFLMDANTMWKGLSEDMDYTAADRAENSRRVAQVSKLMNDAGLIVQSCFTSAYRSERIFSKKILGADNFMEIYVDTPLDVSEGNDTTGFYDKARTGEIQNVAGIDQPYEPPKSPDMIVGAHTHSYEEAADLIFQELIKRGYITKLK